MTYRSKEEWEEGLGKSLWYIKLGDDIKRLFGKEEDKQEKKKLLLLVTKLLKNGRVFLADEGPDFDESRLPIDRIVFHHTGSRVTNLELLSALGMLRLYALDYLDNKGAGRDVYGKDLWSGHFLNGKQVFFPYHWVIFEDGKKSDF